MTKPLTNVGTHTGSYGVTEWALTITIGLIWGSAFLWIAMGVDYLSPQVVAFGRVVLGAGALALFPVARARVAREDWARLGIVAVVGNAAPALLFAVAETELDSAVAGMITSGTPILSLAIASLMLRTLPPRTQSVGIGLGFAGIVLMTLPSLRGAEAAPVGVALVFLATVGYGLSGNLLVPLQQRYGGPAVTLWALAVSSVLLAPGAVLTLEESTFTTSSVVAVVILGVVGTGIARSLAATLAGRAGAPRMSTTTYLIPVVAIVLGVVVRDETVHPLAILGVVVVLSGAIIASRAITTTNSGGDGRTAVAGLAGHVVLVGPMGVGKTTVGTAAARILDRPFLDSDSYVEEVTGQTGRTLAEQHGVAHLHQKEKEFLIAALTSGTPAVVAAAASVSDDSALLSQVLTAGATLVYLERQDLPINSGEAPTRHRRPISPNEQTRINRSRRVSSLAAGGHELSIDSDDSPEDVAQQLINLLGLPS